MHPADPRLNGIYGTILYDDLGDAGRPGAPAQRDRLRRRRGRPVARAARAPAPGSRSSPTEGRAARRARCCGTTRSSGSTFIGTVAGRDDGRRAAGRRPAGHRHGLPDRRAHLRRRPARPARPRVRAASEVPRRRRGAVRALGPAAAVRAIDGRAARRARPRRRPAARARSAWPRPVPAHAVGGGGGGRGQGRDRRARTTPARGLPRIQARLPAVRPGDPRACARARRHRADHPADAGGLGRRRAAAAGRTGRCASPSSAPGPQAVAHVETLAAGAARAQAAGRVTCL